MFYGISRKLTMTGHKAYCKTEARSCTFSGCGSGFLCYLLMVMSNYKCYAMFPFSGLHLRRNYAMTCIKKMIRDRKSSIIIAAHNGKKLSYLFNYVS